MIVLDLSNLVVSQESDFVEAVQQMLRLFGRQLNSHFVEVCSHRGSVGSATIVVNCVPVGGTSHYPEYRPCSVTFHWFNSQLNDESKESDPRISGSFVVSPTGVVSLAGYLYHADLLLCNEERVAALITEWYRIASLVAEETHKSAMAGIAAIRQVQPVR